jgi:hypothetical protein
MAMATFKKRMVSAVVALRERLNFQPRGVLHILDQKYGFFSGSISEFGVSLRREGGSSLCV